MALYPRRLYVIILVAMRTFNFALFVYIQTWGGGVDWILLAQDRDQWR
jgi:hypothetical protein